MPILTREKIITILQGRRAALGSQKAVADSLGVSQQYVCDVLNGRREPGKKMLTALGFSKEIGYKQTA